MSASDNPRPPAGRRRAARTARNAPRAIPINVDRVLLLAASDPDFREDLLLDRRAALLNRDLRLEAAEQAILDSVPDDTLAAMVDAIPPQSRGRRRFMRAVAAAGAVSAGVIQWPGCVTGGRPDRPPDAGSDADVAEDADLDAEVTEDADLDAEVTEDAS